MGNIAYFEIPFVKAERARKFYGKVFGWKIKSTPMEGMPEYSSITTGKPKKSKGMSELNMGGLTKKMSSDHTIMNFVQVKNVKVTLKSVKAEGGKQKGEIMVIPKVGIVAMIIDSEGNTLGIWEAEKK